MPVWGWVCVGFVGLAVVALAAFYFLLILPYDREQKRLAEDGQTVVGRIILANPSLYDTTPGGFEFAFVVFTLAADASEQHLEFLGQVGENLEEFEPDKSNPDEKKLAWAIETQRTIADVVRIPDRVTGGREAYFTTVSVFRRMLPEGKLTRNHLYLRVIPEGKYRAATMTEYPDFPAKSA